MIFLQFFFKKNRSGAGLNFEGVGGGRCGDAHDDGPVGEVVGVDGSAGDVVGADAEDVGSGGVDVQAVVDASGAGPAEGVGQVEAVVCQYVAEAGGGVDDAGSGARVGGVDAVGRGGGGGYVEQVGGCEGGVGFEPQGEDAGGVGRGHGGAAVGEEVVAVGGAAGVDGGHLGREFGEVVAAGG